MYTSRVDYSTPVPRRPQQPTYPTQQPTQPVAQSQFSQSTFNPQQFEQAPPFLGYNTIQSGSPYSAQQQASPYGQQQNNQFGGPPTISAQHQQGGQFGGSDSYGHGSFAGANNTNNNSQRQKEDQPKKYMVGYFSSSIAKEESTPQDKGPDESKSRPWESPTYRPAFNGITAARAPLFATTTQQDDHIAGSPLGASLGQPNLRRRDTMDEDEEEEDDGPPVVSLSELDGHDSSMSFASSEEFVLSSLTTSFPSLTLPLHQAELVALPPDPLSLL
ncbi:hypothetical protein P7C70_g9040, partial [Phenoliferia sp. Uapishka_3]